MSVLHILEVEALVALGAFALSYGGITLALWFLSRDSEKRQRDREAAASRSPSTRS